MSTNIIKKIGQLDGQVKNRYDIMVKVCCASCEFRQVVNDGRICGLVKSPVVSGHCCSQWQMDKRLQDAGRGGGKVKKCHYLTFYMDRWIAQRNDLEARRISALELRSTEDIRREYNEQYGSEFINI